ncbi:Non-histone chromosomal protein 6 [Actinomortierella ambigua]|nr:Non-histone chromosomal protein 6 [Actinomortierella ambigua]
MPKVAKKDTKVSKRAAKAEPAKRKRRAKKDVNAPKNPLSAYLLFCEEFREKIRSENTEASFGEIGKLLGAKWRGYTDEQKAPYIAKHEKAKEKYNQEKAAYDAQKASNDDDDDEDEDDD